MKILFLADIGYTLNNRQLVRINRLVLANLVDVGSDWPMCVRKKSENLSPFVSFSCPKGGPPAIAAHWAAQNTDGSEAGS